MESEMTSRYVIRARQVIVPVGPSVAYVPLTRGEYALIDVEDIQLVAGANWYVCVACGGKLKYAVCSRTKQGKTRQAQIRMHRIILGADDLDVDHKNGNGLDNRRINLRTCSHQQNMANIVRKPGVSGYRGVRPTPAGRWESSINAGLSRDRFAEIVGINQATVIRAEEGAEPSLATALRIANFHGSEVSKIWKIK